MINNVMAQNDIDYVDAIFNMSYNNTSSGGKARLKINNHDGNYESDFVVNHSLLDTQQKAKFTVKDCDINPQSYLSTAKPALRSNTKESLNFDWAKQSVTRQHSKDGNKSFSLEQKQYDPMSLFFKARCDLMAGKKQLSYPVIYKGKQTTHQYHVIGTEVLKTGLGDIEALVVQRQRRNPDRQTVFYVAPSLDYLIVKIQHRESSMASISMTLNNMDYKIKQ